MFRSSIKALILTKSLQKFTNAEIQSRGIKRWVAPTLRELRRRARLLGPQPVQKRSEFAEWNYRSELFAFSKRLHEEFQMPILQSAFTQRSYVLQEQKRQENVGIEEPAIDIKDNVQLAEKGKYLTKEYVNAFLKHSLPKLHDEGLTAIATHLLSVETLSHIALNLGMKDLILSEEYPPSNETFTQSLYAVIGALEESSGVQRAFLFIRDFICAQLNQKDLLEIWDIKEPEEMLRKICAEHKMQEPEPRLIGESAKNTVLAAYHVGIYSNKKMIGTGFGEDVDTAIRTASINALQSLFGIEDHMRPFNFQLKVEPKSIKLSQN